MQNTAEVLVDMMPSIESILMDAPVHARELFAFQSPRNPLHRHGAPTLYRLLCMRPNRNA